MLGNHAIAEHPIGATEEGARVFAGTISLSLNLSSPFSIGPYNFPGRMNERGQILPNTVVTSYGARLHEAYCDESGVSTNDTKPQEQVVYTEEGSVQLAFVVASDYEYEEGSVIIVGDIPLTLAVNSDHELSWIDLGVEGYSIVRAVKVPASVPVLKGRNPTPGQTVVERNRKVEFLLVCSDGDEIDISSVVVIIDGTAYETGDPEFSYSGPEGRRLISVAHPVFDYERKVDVAVEANSRLGGSMEPAAYHYMTEWRPDLTRDN